MTLLISFFSSLAGAQGSAGNPYCASDPRFSTVDCPAPNVCYFKDRLGNVACCPAGQACESAPNNPPAYFLNGALSFGRAKTLKGMNTFGFIYTTATANRDILLLPIAMMAWEIL